MIKGGCIALLLMLMFLQVTAQTAKKIRINVTKTSLSRVLLDLKENYGFQFAFDNDVLSKYLISTNRAFDTREETISYLLEKLPLKVEKSGEVFVIIPVSDATVAVQPVRLTQISGQVMEARTFEPLPFSYVSINNRFIQTDQHGNFNYIASADSTFDLRISHLGYYIYDTIITQSLTNRFLLNPQIEKIAEVKIMGSLVEQSTMIGDKAGRIKINHRIAPVLPGHGDNSVFNLLRLMPGILASGEQSTDLLIWGSYESQSKIQFDGFTIFGLKNFNDDISVVNPFMVKNIEVLKGGYEARYGDRVGGIVDISGKNGNQQKPSFAFDINTTTINSLAEIPLSKKSTVLAAYRQTYYQLYDPTSIDLFNRNKQKDNNMSGTGNMLKFNVLPDYVFRDANLKYVYRGGNGGQFAVSLYGGGDVFDYSMESSVFNTVFKRTEEENNRQFGGSAVYSKLNENGSSTNITASYSIFAKTADEQNKTQNNRTGREFITKQIASENNVDEANFNAEHSIALRDGHNLIFGGGAINNHVQLTRNLFSEKVIDLNSHSTRAYSYVQDEISLTDWLLVKSGLRLIYSASLQKIYAEPRLSSTFKLTDDVKFNASWGLYNQFMSKTIIIDSTLNYSYFWTNSNGADIPVLSAEHWIAGLSYFNNGFTFSTEVYHKNTTGLNRFYNGSKRFKKGFYAGDSKSTGLDVFVKKEYRQHTAWVSYTLSKTLEHFPFYFGDEYKPAPHDQTHELKLAGIFNYKSFWFSANYVYGSGFDRYDFENDEGVNNSQPYKRLDASLVYKFPVKKNLKTELGISVLNVFNTENIKYSSLRKATVDDISLVGVYVDAVPFTPTLFFKIEL